jgi:hypothetical protein
LTGGARIGDSCGVTPPLSLLSTGSEDRMWAVMATFGRESRVAEIFRSREDALRDRDWRAREVSAYAEFLRRAKQPVPHYSVAPIRRSDLPRRWQPLPALGFLHGRFV